MKKNSTFLQRMLVASFSLSVLFLLPGSLQTAQGEEAKTAAVTSEPSFSLRGYFSVKYVARTAESSAERFSDKDFFEELRFDLTTPRTQRYEFHFLGTSRQDVDGIEETATFSPLEDIGDTGNNAVKGYLYEAHFDINRLLSFVPQVRIGRQAGTRDEAVFFDGISVDVAAARNLSVAVYGGAAVHFYELNYDWGSDTLGGAGIDYAPFRSTSLSLDYLSAKDEKKFDSTSTLRDRLLSVKLWQRFTPSVRAMAKYRFMNSDPRDITLRAIAAHSSAGIEVNVNYFRQIRAQNALANEFAVFYDIIGRSEPYQTYDIKARKFLGEHVALDIGYYKRALLEERQQSAFNREYKRSFAVLQFIDVLIDGMTVSFTGERWDSEEREFSSTGGDVGYRFKTGGKAASIGAGTYFSLYKYDYYIDLGERTKVRTYFINGKYPLGKGYAVNAAYEFETGIEDYETVKLGMRYDF